MYKLLLSLLLLIPSVCHAEVNAVIKAPNEVNIGDLVILDSSESTGDNELWVIDPRAEGRYLIFGKQIVFAIGTSGSYDFQLIVADKKATIAQVKHTVKVGNAPDPAPPTDPKPDPPTDPTPSKVKNVSRNAAQALNDKATVDALIKALESSPPEKAAVQAAIGKVLLDRKGDSQGKDWLTLWREPVDIAIKESNQPYETSLKQVIEGLKEVTITAFSISSVTMFTRGDCAYCETWKQSVKSKLKISNWRVEEVISPQGVVPSFEIKAYGKVKYHSGYMSLTQFNQYITSMKD